MILSPLNPLHYRLQRVDEVCQLIDVAILGRRFCKVNFLVDLRELKVLIGSAKKNAVVSRVVDRLQLTCTSLANQISTKNEI